MIVLLAPMLVGTSPPLDADWWGRELLTPAFVACMTAAAAEPPRTRCRSEELGRQSMALDEDFARKLSEVLDGRIRAKLPPDQLRWRRDTDADCHRQGLHSPVGQVREQACKLEAYTARRIQIRIL